MIKKVCSHGVVFLRKMFKIKKKKLNILLVGIYDSKTVSLAPWVLRSYIDQFYVNNENIKIKVKEYSLSQPVEKIADDINFISPDIVGFSVYIWNIKEILQIASFINSKIILGGPHVTGIEYDILNNNQNIDIIITGEGEKALYKLIEYFIEGKDDFSDICGITSRESQNLLEDNISLKKMPFFYEEIFKKHPNLEWITIEASRGCPYKCRYCTWSYNRSMRYFSVNKIKKDLDIILSIPSIKYIYFADSSLLLNKKRAKKILKYLKKKNTKKIIKYEFHYDHFDDEIVDLLSQLPYNEFSFGIQTTNQNCAKIINRSFNANRFEEAIGKIENKFDKQHLTVDLIYGLPGDDLNGFKKSLNYIFGLNNIEKINTYPFLVLPGSYFFKNQQKYDIIINKSNYIAKSTYSFSEKDIEVAKQYSFYIFIIYLNYSVKKVIEKASNDKLKSYIDIIIDFFSYLKFDVDAPYMGYFNQKSLEKKKNRIKEVILKYDEIVRELKDFLNHKYDSLLLDYKDNYSIYYHRYKNIFN